MTQQITNIKVQMTNNNKFKRANDMTNNKYKNTNNEKKKY